MSDPAPVRASVRLARRYLFTDDAIADAMQLVTTLTQAGHADRVRDAIGGVVRAKRALATDKWTRTAEAEFWTSFGRLSFAAREAGIIDAPPPEPVEATGMMLWLRKLVTFPGALVVAVAPLVMCGWLWAKTLADTVDGDRASLRGCLVIGSESKGADEVANAVFGDPAKPGTVPASIEMRSASLESCQPILVALQEKLAIAQRVAALFYRLPSATDPESSKARCSGRADSMVFCQWMYAYNSPANDALGRLVQVFALFILPPILGAMGAWAFTIRQMIRNPATDVTRSRLGDRRHWLNMLFGAMLGSGFGVWVTASGANGPPGLFASMPPFIAAFIGGYGRDFVFAWIDELLQRAGGRGAAPATRGLPDAPERPEPVPTEPRLVSSNRAAGGD